MTRDEMEKRLKSLITWSSEALNSGNIDLCLTYQNEIRLLAKKLA